MKVRLALLGSLAFAALLAAETTPAPRVVPITAKRFEFTPKEVHLVVGEPVVLRLTSEDVAHGLLARPLGVDADITPGKPTDVTVTPKKAGTFTAICDRFCGSGHGNMKLKFVVEERTEPATN
jgi:cytochrome c oxidase subunit II